VRHDDKKFEETPDIRVLQRDIRAKNPQDSGNDAPLSGDIQAA